MKLLKSIFTAILLLVFFPVVHSSAQDVIFSDEFDVDGTVDQTLWRLPFGGDGSFYGQTQAKTNLQTDYPSVANGVATLELDTYLDDGNGNSSGAFSGAELISKRNFVVGGGLSLEVRARLVNPVPGLVGGVFLFDVQRTNGNDQLVRDEIDVELISNSTDTVFTNLWNDLPFDQSGDGQTDSPGGSFDITDFHDYRVEWFPNRIDWYVDGAMIRSESADIADDPMRVHLNFWVPDASFTNAYDPNLNPAASSAQNVTYEMEIDSVVVTQLNTTAGPNLMGDSDFEDTSFPLVNLNSGGSPDQAATGSWFTFSNASISTEYSLSGSRSLKMFGPFSGGPNASGAFQNVDVSPGDVLAASVFAQTPVGDAIVGSANYAAMKVEFLDASGDIIPGLGEFIGANGKENVIIEGRDLNTPEGVWIQRDVNAIAPPGATKARVSLLFVQLNNEGGAVFFDDLTITTLDAAAVPVTVAPTSFQFTRGNYSAGALADLAVSDNTDVSGRRNNGDIQSRIFLEVKATSPTPSPTLMSFTLEGSVFARSNVVQTLELFDYDAGAWVSIDSRNANRFSDVTVEASPTGDLSRFVEDGTNCIEARVRYQSTNPRQLFSANIDVTTWTIQ